MFYIDGNDKFLHPSREMGMHSVFRAPNIRISKINQQPGSSKKVRFVDESEFQVIPIPRWNKRAKHAELEGAYLCFNALDAMIKRNYAEVAVETKERMDIAKEFQAKVLPLIVSTPIDDDDNGMSEAALSPEESSLEESSLEEWPLEESSLEESSLEESTPAESTPAESTTVESTLAESTVTGSTIPTSTSRRPSTRGK